MFVTWVLKKYDVELLELLGWVRCGENSYRFENMFIYIGFKKTQKTLFIDFDDFCEYRKNRQILYKKIFKMYYLLKSLEWIDEPED